MRPGPTGAVEPMEKKTSVQTLNFEGNQLSCFQSYVSKWTGRRNPH
jgi:hypothetical protein